MMHSTLHPLCQCHLKPAVNVISVISTFALMLCALSLLRSPHSLPMLRAHSLCSSCAFIAHTLWHLCLLLSALCHSASCACSHCLQSASLGSLSAFSSLSSLSVVAPSVCTCTPYLVAAHRPVVVLHDNFGNRLNRVLLLSCEHLFALIRESRKAVSFSNLNLDS